MYTAQAVKCMCHSVLLILYNNFRLLSLKAAPLRLAPSGGTALCPPYLTAPVRELFVQLYM